MQGGCASTLGGWRTHPCSLQNFPEGAQIEEEVEPGTWVRHNCLAVTADSSTEVVKRKETAANQPRGRATIPFN